MSIDLQFSTYFVPSKLTAQDGMDVSLENFEKVTIDGNVAATILGTALLILLLEMRGQIQLPVEEEPTRLLEDLDLILLFLLVVILELHWTPQIRLLILQQVLIKLILAWHLRRSGRHRNE
jgi:hypothetical protein